MKFIVCVKQVPGSNEVRLDPETHAIIRDAHAAVINPLDYVALDCAVKLKRRNGGEIIALSMGIPATERLLRDACARGADRAMLLTDRAFAGSDTLATSYALSLGIEKEGSCDLILCGKNAIDGDTAQIGPELAATLGYNLITDVTEVIDIDKKFITAVKTTDSGSETVKAALPAVITLLNGREMPALPTVSGVRYSLEAPVDKYTAAELGADTSRTGFAGSPTSVVKTFVSENTRECRDMGLDAAAAAAFLIDEIRKAGGAQ